MCYPQSSGSADVVGAALCEEECTPTMPGREKCVINVGSIKVFVEESSAAAGRQSLAGGGMGYKTLTVGGAQISCGSGANFKYLQGI